MYKYDKNTLQFIKVNWIYFIFKIIGIIIIFLLILNWSTPSKRHLSESEIMIIISSHNQFSKEKLIKLVSTLNFKFPYIVYAQAELESNYFQSNIFKENKNLFGMKKAITRINTSEGEQNQHAFYNDWMDSVYDYALYSATYLSSLKTEEEYLNFLSQYYAEDSQYINKLKNIIKKENLISKFNNY